MKVFFFFFKLVFLIQLFIHSFIHFVVVYFGFVWVFGFWIHWKYSNIVVFECFWCVCVIPPNIHWNKYWERVVEWNGQHKCMRVRAEKSFYLILKWMTFLVGKWWWDWCLFYTFFIVVVIIPMGTQIKLVYFALELCF